jgi:hypothetical protein
LYGFGGERAVVFANLGSPHQTDNVITTPVDKCGDPVAANRQLTMHQAVSPITMFGHRISKGRILLMAVSDETSTVSVVTGWAGFQAAINARHS